jgi:glycosyltransferase involved in cell wall biosynthesis
VRQEEITNVQVLPLQPASRLPEIYSVGDIELVPIEEGITKIALPSKIGVIMSCGSPILALVDNDSEIEKIINEQRIGVAIEHGSSEKLKEAIIYCYEHKSELDEWGKNARTFAVENYSRKTQTKKYFDVMEQISRHGV